MEICELASHLDSLGFKIADHRFCLLHRNADMIKAERPGRR
jgi:hypothetical protein